MATAVQLPDNALHIIDTLSRTKYLVDTGACCSLFPASPSQRTQADPDPVALVSAAGEAIPTHGTAEKIIQLAGQSYRWSFRLADVSQPLLGADFLIHHKLIVDMAGRALIPASYLSNSNPARSAPIHGVQQPTPTVNMISNSCGSSSGSVHATYSALKERYSDVFKPELRLRSSGPTNHGIEHFIDTTGPPQYSRYRRLEPRKLAAAKASFAEMVRMGVCERGSSPWASPLHMVKKADGTWRPCGDYRKLNNVTTADRYPMPNIADITNVIGDATVFSKLDLLKAYFQVPVHQPDQAKTAITTPFGSYIFKYSTFGLKNNGATFQRLMDSIFG